MGYKYSKKSEAQLLTCHVSLQALFREILKHRDHTILIGHRSKVGQDKAFNTGASKVQWPNSKHNKTPSLAIDVAPYPIDWGETGTSHERQSAIRRFYEFHGYVDAIAVGLHIPLRWGGDWDGDLDFSDQRFNDLVHYEIKT